MPLHDDMRCPVPPRGFESYESPDSERKYERADAVTRRATGGPRRATLKKAQLLANIIWKQMLKFQLPPLWITGKK
jgi:hypothetical protein